MTGTHCRRCPGSLFRCRWTTECPSVTMVKCVVSGCPNRKANVSRTGGTFNRTPKRFFSFPTDPTRVKVWLAALREMDKQDSTEPHLICEDHFLPKDITADGVISDAIPIMPPCLDVPLGLISPWEPESPDEEGEGEEEEEEDEGGDPSQQDPGGGLENSEETSPLQHRKQPVESNKVSRHDVSLGLLTRRFMALLVTAPDGSLDLRQVVRSLGTRKRRVYDITNTLEGLRLIQKESVNRIKWIGRYPISIFLRKNHHTFLRELQNLKQVEDTLDGLIKSCSQQLFDMTDDEGDSAWAYVTHEDVSRLRVFRDQTLVVVKAPEETKLEIPAPTEESIQVHLKAARSPIMVLSCEVGSGGSVTSDPTEKGSFFLTLEESRVRTTLLPTGPQSV